MTFDIYPNAPYDGRRWLSRLLWLLTDRVFLGVVVLICGFLLNGYLQKDQRIGDYQKLLFDKRVKAYEELTAAARGARDQCALAHRQFLPTPDRAWEARLAAAADGIWGLVDRGTDVGGSAGNGGGDAGDTGSSAGGGDNGSSGGERPLAKEPRLYEWQAGRLTEAVKMLRELERTRTEGSLYISGPVNASIDKLLETLFADIEVLRRRIGNKQSPFYLSVSPDDKTFLERAVVHAEESYNNLFLAITDALRVKEMILG